jgi:hypothetical protein
MHRSIPPVLLAGFLGVLLAPATRAATDGELSVSLGAEYTSGDYGTSSTTNIWYFPVTFGYESDRNRIALTVPYVSVEGTGNVVASLGGMGLRRTTTNTRSRTESGLGDLLLVGSHKIGGSATSRVDLTGKIKFGTADRNKNLGSGEDDFAVQLDAEKDYDRDTVYGSGGYKLLGDPPGVNYDNVLYGIVGVSHKLDQMHAAGVELYAQQAALPGTDGPFELTVFLSGRADRHARLTGYLIKGFSNGSPDWGAGVALKLSR